jgi:hypothetical protein
VDPQAKEVNNDLRLNMDAFISSSEEEATSHDEPRSLVLLFAIGPDLVTFVSNF